LAIGSQTPSTSLPISSDSVLNEAWNQSRRLLTLLVHQNEVVELLALIQNEEEQERKQTTQSSWQTTQKKNSERTARTLYDFFDKILD